MSLTKQEFKQRREHYLEILKGTKSHSEGEAHQQARRYWLEQLAEPVVERARAELSEKGKLPEVDLLISVAGFSPETTITTARVFQPRRILVISSQEAYENINVIAEYLYGNGVRAKDFSHTKCKPADLSLFQIVQRHVQEHREERSADKGKNAGDILIDITGGKKIMSAVAAMAAWELDLRICYVNTKQDEKLRVAIPGTEEIVVLDNPCDLFGDTEFRRANHDFNLGAYEAARVRYEGLAERLNEPARARFLRDLSDLYDAWRSLHLDRLKIALPRLRERLEEPTSVAHAYRAQLDTQLQFIERLIAKERSALIMTLFLLGEANMRASRYDFAALLFYRTIEASLSSRIEQRYEGFDCEHPDYGKIDGDASATEARIVGAAKKILPHVKTYTLPQKLGCIDCGLLLFAENDTLLTDAGLDSEKPMQHLQTITTTRNRSILAHGYETVTEDACKTLRATAQSLLKAYWTLNENSVDFHRALKQLNFIQLTP